MKSKFAILALSTFVFSSCLLLISCQKEVDGSLDDRLVSIDSTTLSKYILMDTSLPVGLDTLEVTFFEYDNLKRLINVIEYGREDTSSSPVYPSRRSTTFFYNGNDTLPYKTIAQLQDVLYNQQDTSYFEYQNGFVSLDSSRQKSTGSFGPNRFGLVFRFSRSGNTVFCIERYTSDLNNPASVCESNTTYSQTYVNNNVASLAYTSTGCATGFGDDLFLYDTKINPFYTAIPIHYLTPWFEYSESCQQNNLTEERSVSKFSHYKYVYNYNSKNLPLVVRMINQDNPAEIYKGIFYYQ